MIRQWLLLTLHHPLGRGVAQLSQFAGSLLLALRRAVASGNRTIAASSLKMNDVFTTQALNSSLTREYVALYGLLTSSHQGRKLLRSAASDFSTSIASIARAQPGSGVGESSPVVDVDMPDAVLCLRPLFSSPSQASLCRLLLLSLSYGECTPARQLLESVTLAPTGDGPYTPGYASQSPVSLSIKMFCISALQACFRRGVVGFKEWGVDLLLHVIASEGQSAAPLKVPAYHLLVELCNIQCYCKAVARKLRLLDGKISPECVAFIS